MPATIEARRRDVPTAEDGASTDASATTTDSTASSRSVAAWFRATFGEPTPPQRLGWPAIAAGRNTLIFAPTGSGKTLAAFLACLDHLWRTPGGAAGVRILYVSPLKALNQDIYRNLQVPLDGILATAEARRGRPCRRSRSPSGAATPRPPTASGWSASRPTS